MVTLRTHLFRQLHIPNTQQLIIMAAFAKKSVTFCAGTKTHDGMSPENQYYDSLMSRILERAILPTRALSEVPLRFRDAVAEKMIDFVRRYNKLWKDHPSGMKGTEEKTVRARNWQGWETKKVTKRYSCVILPSGGGIGLKLQTSPSHIPLVIKLREWVRATLIQRTWKKYRAGCPEKFIERKKIAHVIKIQAAWRGYKCKMAYPDERRERERESFVWRNAHVEIAFDVNTPAETIFAGRIIRLVFRKNVSYFLVKFWADGEIKEYSQKKLQILLGESKIIKKIKKISFPILDHCKTGKLDLLDCLNRTKTHTDTAECVDIIRAIKEKQGIPEDQKCLKFGGSIHGTPYCFLG